MDYLFRRQRLSSLGTPQPKRISTAAGQRLSTIVEGATSQPSSSRLSNMSWAHRIHLGQPPAHDAEKEPPQYEPPTASAWETDTSPSVVEAASAGGDEPPPRIEARGGWKRLGLVVAAVLLVAIALAVGLGVGLTARSRAASGSPSASAASSAASSLPAPFPIGAWSIYTALKTQTTDCTATADTWSCLPYVTYAQSALQSETIYNWDVSAQDPSRPSNDSLLIATARTDLLLQFGSTPLRLVDAGLPSERYTFTVTVPKTVYPLQSLSGDNSRSVCYYNQTVLAAALYTRQPASYARAGASNASTSLGTSQAARKMWAAAADVDFTAAGGASVPDCYPAANNGAAGPRITAGLAPQDASRQCACVYTNFNLTAPTR